MYTYELIRLIRGQYHEAHKRYYYTAQQSYITFCQEADIPVVVIPFFFPGM